MASARAKPPPLAGPLTQAMIGCGQRRIAITISLILRWLVSPSLTVRAVSAIAAVVALLQVEPGAEAAARALQHDKRTSFFQ